MRKTFSLIAALSAGLVFTSCVGNLDFPEFRDTLSVYNDTQAGSLEIDGQTADSFPVEFDPFPSSCSLKATADTERGYTFEHFATAYSSLFENSAYRDFSENPKTFDFKTSISKEDVNLIYPVYSRFSFSSTALTGKTDPVLC